MSDEQMTEREAQLAVEREAEDRAEYEREKAVHEALGLSLIAGRGSPLRILGEEVRRLREQARSTEAPF